MSLPPEATPRPRDLTYTSKTVPAKKLQKSEQENPDKPRRSRLLYSKHTYQRAQLSETCRPGERMRNWHACPTLPRSVERHALHAPPGSANGQNRQKLMNIGLQVLRVESPGELTSLHLHPRRAVSC